MYVRYIFYRYVDHRLIEHVWHVLLAGIRVPQFLCCDVRDVDVELRIIPFAPGCHWFASEALPVLFGYGSHSQPHSLATRSLYLEGLPGSGVQLGFEGKCHYDFFLFVVGLALLDRTH